MLAREANFFFCFFFPSPLPCGNSQIVEFVYQETFQWKFIYEVAMPVFDLCIMYILVLKLIIRVVFKIKGSIWKRNQKTLFPYRKLWKGTSDLCKPCIHCIFICFWQKNFLKKINHWEQYPEVRHSFGLELPLIILVLCNWYQLKKCQLGKLI